MTKSIIKYFSLLIFASLAFYGCFSPYKGDEAALTLLFGNNSGGRALISDEVVHNIELDGPSGRRFLPQVKGARFSVTVIPGYWKISIKAYLGDRLYAEGADGAEVKAGQNNQVIINMSLVYTVSFNGGIDADGMPPPPKTQESAGAEIILPGPGGLSKKGFYFSGWSKEDGKYAGSEYDAYKPPSDITLYANWEAIGPAIFTVTFDGNGANGMPPPAMTQEYENQAIILPDSWNMNKTDDSTNPPIYLTFGGWSKSPAPTPNDYIWKVDDEFYPSENTTMYAVWNKD